MREGRKDVVTLSMKGHESEGVRLAELFLYAVCELFDDGVGEYFAGNALDLGSGGLRLQAICKR